MKLEKSIKMVFLGLIIVLLMVSNASAGKAEDTVVIAYESKAPTMFRYATTDTITMNLWLMCNDGLTVYSKEARGLVPNVAESYKRINPTTWQVKLRKGIKFHSGNELTSESYRFTIMDICKDKSLKLRYTWPFIKDIEVIDKYTFNIITKGPFPIMHVEMQRIFPLDPAVVKEKGVQWLYDNIVGIGPYQFVKWVKGESVTITANPNYWNKKQASKIKNVKFRIIPDMSTMVAEMRTGKIDLMEIDPDKTRQIEKDPKLKIISGLNSRMYFYQFDSMGKASKSPVMDVRVRRAIWHAIDRETIVKSMLQGYGAVRNGVANSFLLGHDPTLKGYEYSPEKAKTLLKEAGYANGFEIDLWQYNNTTHLFNMAAMGYLAKVGIKVKIRDYRGNAGQLGKFLWSGKVSGILNYSWGGVHFDGDQILAKWFLMKDKKCYTKDEELDKWLKEARYSMDINEREALYIKAQKRIIDQAYWVPLFQSIQVMAVTRDLNFEIFPTGFVPMQYASWVE